MSARHGWWGKTGRNGPHFLFSLENFSASKAKRVTHLSSYVLSSMSRAAHSASSVLNSLKFILACRGLRASQSCLRL